ncbi:hypothetical protein CR66_09475 [Campylobacter mucosalis]|jgi:hypothetical protein|nr:hypothetical protein CR66_09475 [Campylobacter mucosalis]KZM63681.1 hypothetical protein AWN62_10030 [Streptococcus mutans]
MFPRVSVFSASVFSASVFSASVFSASASASVFSAVKKSEELGYPGHLSLWKKKKKKIYAKIFGE